MIKKSCAIILSVICGVVVVVFSDSAALSSGNETSVSVPSGYSAGNTLIVEGRDLTYQEAADLFLENERLRNKLCRLKHMINRLADDLQAIQEYMGVTCPN